MAYECHTDEDLIEALVRRGYAVFPSEALILLSQEELMEKREYVALNTEMQHHWEQKVRSDIAYKLGRTLVGSINYVRNTHVEMANGMPAISTTGSLRVVLPPDRLQPYGEWKAGRIAQGIKQSEQKLFKPEEIRWREEDRIRIATRAQDAKSKVDAS